MRDAEHGVRRGFARIRLPSESNVLNYDCDPFDRQLHSFPLVSPRVRFGKVPSHRQRESDEKMCLIVARSASIGHVQIEATSVSQSMHILQDANAIHSNPLAVHRSAHLSFVAAKHESASRAARSNEIAAIP